MTGRIAWLALMALVAVVTVFAQLDRSARFDPALAALVPAPFAGFSAQRTTEAALVAGDADMALENAQALVRRRPMPAEHLTLLAQAYAASGNEVASLQALEAAARRGWREPFAQNAMAAAALASGEQEIAAQRLAALWAIGLERDRLANLTRTMLAEPEGRAAFAAQLAQEGRWQANFVTGAASIAPPPHVADTIVRAREMGASLDCRALAGLADGLTGSGEAALAARVRAGC